MCVLGKHCEKKTPEIAWLEDLIAGHCPHVPIDAIWRGVVQLELELKRELYGGRDLAEELEVTTCQELQCDAELLFDDTATIW